MTNHSSIDTGNETTRSKIVFVGDIFVGKTTIMYNFIDNIFKEKYEVIY